MRIGYCFHGFLGDVKMDADGNEVSTPDGNATYSWSIEHECMKRKFKLIPLGDNLDGPAVSRFGVQAFEAFSPKKRARSYERMLSRGWAKLSDRRFPELDAVLIEWRWPIPGRNTRDMRGQPGFQNDLDRQWEVIRHYSDRNVPIIIWDLDHKLTVGDEDMLSDACIEYTVIETATKPRRGHTRVEPPIDTLDLLQFDIDDRMPTRHLGYIGSRYERDGVIDEWVNPTCPPMGHRAKFWGKWEPAAEVQARWPGINFAGRIGVRGFREAYSRVAAVPLLAKPSYFECGFITPRVWEAVLFGSIPVGLSPHKGIEQYVDRVATGPQHLMELATELRTMSPLRRRVIREEAAHRLSHTDARHFVDVIEGLVSHFGATFEPDAVTTAEKEDTNHGQAIDPSDD